MAQSPALPPLPPAQGVPSPRPATTEAYAPGPILPGGIVIPLYPASSPKLNASRVREAEVYNMSQTVPGRIASIVNIHNPSIEVHLTDRGINTGSVIILAAGGGHNTLNVGSEAADFVPFFYNFGVNTVILRNRLRRDGYNPFTDAVSDTMQAIRIVRAYAKEWNIDPNRIGVMGFSAGAELASSAAVEFEEFDRAAMAGAPFQGVSTRPDFVGIIYPGPTPFARNRQAPTALPRRIPPAFLATPGAGDRVHAFWALEYFQAMLNLGVPNVEMHVYGHGRHPGETLPDGRRMTAGLTDRNGMPFGTWQHRFIDWFRDLGFLTAPGTETKAARDLETYLAQPLPRPWGEPRTPAPPK
jgi:acetyl esterase/lipase